MPAIASRLASVRRFFPANSSAILRGLALGLGFVVLHRGWTATFGTILAAELVMLWMGCLGMIVAQRLERATRGIPSGNWSLLLGALIAAAPWLLAPAATLVSLLPLGALSLRSAQIVALLPAGLLVWGVPSFLATCHVEQMRRTPAGGLTSLAFGTACGILLATNLVGPWLGPQVMAWIAAGVFAVDAVRQLTRGTAASTAIESSESETQPLPVGNWSVWLLAGSGTALLACVLDITGQWTLSSAWRTYTIAAALVLGGVAAATFGATRPGRWLAERLPNSTPVFVTCAVALSMFIASDFWLGRMLAINVNLSQPATILICRALVLGLVPFGCGWTAVRLLARVTTAQQSRTGLGLTVVGAWTLTCLAIAIQRGISPGAIAALSATGIAAAMLVEQWRVTAGQRRRRVVAVAACGMLVVAGGLSLGYSPLTTSRLLFNSNVAMFSQRGADWSRLHVLDSARPTGTNTGETGMFTAWDHFGLQTVIKRNGVPIGYVSHDYRLMPQAPTDILLAALPLTIHEAPMSACFLGWGAGVPISTALEFPIERVVCADAEALLPELTFPAGEPQPFRGIDPRQDSRATFLPIPPALAVRGGLPSFDVVVSNPPLSALADASPEYTQEFYVAAARHLNPGGLFCQRVQHADQRLQGFLDVLATVQSVFPHVVSINFMPGETLLIGRLDREFFALPELPERFQAPHVARVLSRCGWDWGHMAQIPMLAPAAVESLLSERAADVNRAGDDRIAFSHPLELVRWGNKWQEKQQALMSLQTRLIDLAGEAAQTEEVKRRISETKLQQYVMSEVPDRPWAYRANLKKELQTKARTKLVQVKGERPRQELHPVDQHRFEYLKALAGAYKASPPTADQIHHLTEFVAPYDPLLTYFIHYEAAELYSRNPEIDPRAEFLHRLHTVYFGDARDRSIRNVTACLELLAENPTLAETDSERFDRLNGLLQILYQRWQTRRGLAPDSVSVALNDITESISVAEEALAVMDTLSGEKIPGAEHWEARKQFIDSELIRPLRSYRGQMLPEQAKLMQKMKSAAEASPAEEPTEESADFQLDETTESEP